MVSRAQVLAKHGFSTLLIDLQGHGEPPGDAITFGYRESNDVMAAIAWIKARAPNRKIGVIGCSLGGAAFLLAPQPLGVDAIVLEEVFPRIGKAVENRLRLRIGPLAPFVAPLLLAQLGPRLHIHSSDLEPIRFIAMAGAPILIAAGADDPDTTLAESNDLFQAAQDPKDMWVVKGAKHQDLLRIDPSGYESHVLRFLIQNLRGQLAPTHKLGKSEIQDLIDEDIRNKKPLTFTSNQGVIHCCDLGEPSVRFSYDHRAVAFGDGFVLWIANFSYEILANGTISFGRSDTTDVAAWVKKAELEDAAVYSYGDSLYLVKG